jgi:hypothetical protein
MHRLFSGAPPNVLEAIVCNFFTRVGSRRSRELRSRIMDFVDRKRHATILASSLPVVRPPQGRVYDLLEVRDRVLGCHVPELRAHPLPVRMGWSRRVTPSLMGKWIETPPGLPNLVVINSLLDDERVPRFYLEYIVFHEVLHEVYPIRRVGGRWVQHSVEFRLRERKFPRYAQARRWEKENLHRLRDVQPVDGERCSARSSFARPAPLASNAGG